MTSTGRAAKRKGGLRVGPYRAHSALEQLLHALNQPLTGLQCSMEVALAAPRTAEHYVRTLQEGLRLTGRMRILAGAIREMIAAGDDAENRLQEKEMYGRAENLAWKTFLQELVDELAPVAAVKGVGFVTDFPAAASATVMRSASRMKAAFFRLLDSAVSLAETKSAIRVEGTGATMRVQWKGGEAGDPFTTPELGLLVAQAVFERGGAIWEHHRTKTLRTVTIRLRSLSESGPI